MENLYLEKYSLDERARENFGLDAGVMMEHAAVGMAQIIRARLHKNAVVLIITGSGDNGGDGYALARILAGEFRVKIYQAKPPKSQNCVAQFERAKKIENIAFVDKIIFADCVVDCLVGAGLDVAKGEFEFAQMDSVNAISALKIACDVPSGIYNDGKVSKSVFKADICVSMGALSASLFSDAAKDFVGEVVVADLGISRKNYEVDSELKLLTRDDLCLPLRKNYNVNKGSFGHAVVFAGSKVGASLIAAHAALSFGAGLASVEAQTKLDMSLNPEIMACVEVPKNATALACGMGLGERCAEVLEIVKNANLPVVIDADMCHEEGLIEFLGNLDSTAKVVLTPHVKEFHAMLKAAGWEVSLESLIAEKLRYGREFALKFPHAVLLLKGANVIIAKNEQVFINPLGSNALAKGGSGDVLSGLIAALLAQGKSDLESAIQASLAHSIASQNLVKSAQNFALTPLKLIDYISQISKD